MSDVWVHKWSRNSRFFQLILSGWLWLMQSGMAQSTLTAISFGYRHLPGYHIMCIDVVYGSSKTVPYICHSICIDSYPVRAPTCSSGSCDTRVFLGFARIFSMEWMLYDGKWISSCKYFLVVNDYICWYSGLPEIYVGNGRAQIRLLHISYENPNTIFPSTINTRTS